MGVTEIHEMDSMGAHGLDGEVWLPRSQYTRTQARTFFADLTGEPWINARVLARHMRHAPELPEAYEYDGEFWVECDAGERGAFPVWRCC